MSVDRYTFRQDSSFATRFQTLSDWWSSFCFGLDPSPQLLESWGLERNIDGLRTFCDLVAEAAIGQIGLVKPQIAFFEAFGPEGLKCLQDLIRLFDREGLLVIADGKRNDIGSTMDAYAQAWLGASSPFCAHAITTTPAMGLGAMAPLLTRAHIERCGVFVVVRSSNPEGQEIQNAQIGTGALANKIADDITTLNAAMLADDAFEQPNQADIGQRCGPIGAVIGATLGGGIQGQTARETISRLPHSLFLVPGLGAQGGTFTDLAKLFAAAKGRVIPTSSRGILAHGPSVQSLKAALRSHADQTVSCLT